MSEREFFDYCTELREFIGRNRLRTTSAVQAAPALVEEDEFNHLVLALFHRQFRRIETYRRYCQLHQVSPASVSHWTRVPAMPVAAFKEFELTNLPREARTVVFHSSGTTGQKPSQQFHSPASLRIYEASLLQWFCPHLLRPMEKRIPMIFLTPEPRSAPHSSLVYMFETVRLAYGAEESIFLGVTDGAGAWTLDQANTVSFLKQAVQWSKPVALLGTAFNFVHLLDFMVAQGLSLPLPLHSRVLETGGYKGRSRTLSKDELHAWISERLGVPASHIICEYGMCELSSQAYDRSCPLLQPSAQSPVRLFRFPPWARAQIVSPESGLEVGEGETGLIRVVDLANIHSVMAIQTEDLGVRRGDGFELLGRAALTEVRGCSLMSMP